MSNQFEIPIEAEQEIKTRDKTCVYCRKSMQAHHGIKGTPGDKATIEHLNFDGPFYWIDGLKKEDLVICCGSCNASRGNKKLPDWFQTDYCKNKNINENTISEEVKRYLSRFLIQQKQTIKNPKWIFAKTYAEFAPHEYILKGQYSDIFTKFEKLLQEYGVEQPFTLFGETKTYRYYYHKDGYKYWIIDNVLNREPTQVDFKEDK